MVCPINPGRRRWKKSADQNGISIIDIRTELDAPATIRPGRHIDDMNRNRVEQPDEGGRAARDGS